MALHNIVESQYEKPIANLVPFRADENKSCIYGYLKGMVELKNNIIDEKWEVDE
ncbi:hypothetical protein GMMP15_860036 [Candidatus Magnetomoraceae bacterium gMMP-15]